MQDSDICTQAYESLCYHYVWWMVLPFDDFQALINMEDQKNILLATHWAAVQQCLTFIYEAETRSCSEQSMAQHLFINEKGGNCTGLIKRHGPLRWLSYFNRCVDDEHQQHNTWPAWVEAMVDCDPNYFLRQS